MPNAWYLSYRFDAPIALEHIHAAIESVCGQTLTVSREEWNGNPRDFYTRAVRASTDRARGYHLEARLGLEHAQIIDGPVLVDTTRVQITLHGDDPRTLDGLWQRLSIALTALGARDDTLAQSSAAIVDQLAAAGFTERARELRAAITEALVAHIAAGPDHWPIAVRFARPDDLDRVLRAAPSPSQVKSIALTGLALTALPRTLLQEPALFPALTQLDLAWNQLTHVPPLVPLYAHLQLMCVSGNPLREPLRSEQWPRVRIVAR